VVAVGQVPHPGVWQLAQFYLSTNCFLLQLAQLAATVGSDIKASELAANPFFQHFIKFSTAIDASPEVVTDPHLQKNAAIAPTFEAGTDESELQVNPFAQHAQITAESIKASETSAAESALQVDPFIQHAQFAADSIKATDVEERSRSAEKVSSGPVIDALQQTGARLVKVPAVVVPNTPVVVFNPPMPRVGQAFVGGQFHAQDELGQYAFGHYGGPYTKVEAKDQHGRLSGSFAYVDAEGNIQMRQYSSNPGEGFKVSGSDLPVGPLNVSS